MRQEFQWHCDVRCLVRSNGALDNSKCFCIDDIFLTNLDFYQYSCGGWLADNNIPVNYHEYGVTTAMANRNDGILYEFLIQPRILSQEELMQKNISEAEEKVRHIFELQYLMSVYKKNYILSLDLELKIYDITKCFSYSLLQRCARWTVLVLGDLPEAQSADKSSVQSLQGHWSCLRT